MSTLKLFLLTFLLPCCIANAQWIQTNGPDGSNVGTFVVRDSTLFSIKDSASLGVSILRSTNSGASWTNLSLAPSRFGIEQFAVSGQNLFVETSGSLIYRSTDNGDTWKKVNEGFSVDKMDVLAIFGDYLYAGFNSDGLYRSTDSGMTWSKMDSGLKSHNIYTFIASGTNLFIGTASGVFRSIDSGMSWTEMDAGITDRTIISCAVSGTNLFISGGQAGVFRSIDNGLHWVHTDLMHVTHSFAVSGVDVLAGTESYGVYLSVDGLHWTQVNDGLPNKVLSYVLPFIIYRDTVFASTSQGYWKRPLSEMIRSSVLSYNHPTQSHLNQNYPNPFSASTTILFDLPERTFVSLKVYDITGREVTVLANEMLDAGSYTRKFNADALPSGTYICRLKAGVYTQMRTLFLLR